MAAPPNAAGGAAGGGGRGGRGVGGVGAVVLPVNSITVAERLRHQKMRVYCCNTTWLAVQYKLRKYFLVCFNLMCVIS